MIAIVPARGGSKGLPGKNIKPLNGKPLIAHTINAAQKSKYITDVFVSTDSKDIALTAKKYGAWVPELRPKHLATDDAKSIDVFIYTVKLLEKKYNRKIQSFVVLQPTSPLRTYIHINESIELFNKMQADSVVSFTQEDHPIHWNKYIDAEGIITNVFEDNRHTNRQEYRKTFYPNGAIYVFNENLISMGKYYSERSFAYVMEKYSSLDIDTLHDFDYAEFLIQNMEIV